LNASPTDFKREPLQLSFDHGFQEFNDNRNVNISKAFT